jgi:hypothetical protein
MQTQLPGGLTVLTAMITPAVLLSACASLIIATQSRLNRAVDRSRELLKRVQELRQQGSRESIRVDAEVRLIYAQLDFSTTRSRLLQHALAGLYYSVGAFVATSVASAFAALTGMGYAAAISVGITGAGLLLYASLILVRESRIALAGLHSEMDYVWEEGRSHAPEELIETTPRRGRRRRRRREKRAAGERNTG